MYYLVVDWSDGAHRALGRERIVDKFELLGQMDGFCYDRGRLEIMGVDHTIYVSGNQFSIREVHENEYEEAVVDGE